MAGGFEASLTGLRVQPKAGAEMLASRPLRRSLSPTLGFVIRGPAGTGYEACVGRREFVVLFAL